MILDAGCRVMAMLWDGVKYVVLASSARIALGLVMVWYQGKPYDRVLDLLLVCLTCRRAGKYI